MADERLAARLAVLRAKFVSELADDRTALRELRGTPPVNPALGAILHRLAGRAGTFGFPVISDIAGRLEALCQTAQPNGGSDEIASLLDMLDEAIAIAAQEGS